MKIKFIVNPIAGKAIVQRLVEDIVKVCDKKVDEIAFIIGDLLSLKCNLESFTLL